jgi:hypothetical protein
MTEHHWSEEFSADVEQRCKEAAERQVLRAAQIQVARDALRLCISQEADAEALADLGRISADALLEVQAMTRDARLQLSRLERGE